MKKLQSVSAVLAFLFLILMLGSSCTNRKKHYVIGINTYLVPFSYRTADHQNVGIDIEILDAVAREMKFDYSLKEVTYADFIQHVQKGTVDGVLAAVTVSGSRKKYLDYSIPYFETGIEIIVHEDNHRIRNLKGLRGATVAVLEGSTMCQYAEKNADILGFGKLLKLKTSDQTNSYLLEGKADAVISEIPIVRYLINQGFPFKSIFSFTESDFAFAVKKGENSELLEAYNIGFAKIVSNGKFRKIVEKYYE